MSTYTIGQIAERSGFSIFALRYYEGIGLVVPSARSDAGRLRRRRRSACAVGAHGPIPVELTARKAEHVP